MAQEQALQKPHGRRIGSWKQKARAALPHGSLQDQADYANQLATQEGYLLQLKAEQMEMPKNKQQPAPVEAKAQPTVLQLKELVGLAKAQGGVAALLDKARAVEEVARHVGDLANLVAWLEILLNLQDGTQQPAANGQPGACCGGGEKLT